MQAAPESARRTDAIEVERLRNAAARWLLSRGIDQWTVDEVDTATFEEQIAAGEWHVVRHGDRLVACLRLLWADPAVWGDAPPVAGYVHGLTTDREHGRGLGSALLDWAGGQVVQRGRSLLRLDCQEHNQLLRTYYRRLGFGEVGRTHFGPDSPWHPVIRLERREDRRARPGERRPRRTAPCVSRRVQACG